MMRAAVIVYPGSNCDRDVTTVLHDIMGEAPLRVWHADTELPKVDMVVLPGGFSYGDYLRCGAMAARSPIMREVKAHAERGGYVLGICNGFQILTETGLLPGVLMPNAGLHFVCKDTYLRVERNDTPSPANMPNSRLSTCRSRIMTATSSPRPTSCRRLKITAKWRSAIAMSRAGSRKRPIPTARPITSPVFLMPTAACWA